VFPLLAKRTDVARTAGKPLLHWAAERGYERGHHSLLPLVQRLCAAKVNLNHVHNGNTPLTTAIKHGRKVIVEELLNAGAKPVVPGVPHALDLAIKNAARGDTSVVDLLLESKWRPNVNYIDTAPDNRHSPLFDAALRTSRTARLAVRLLHCGADPNLPNKDGMTPLHSAAKFNSAKMVKQLLDRGRANPNVRSTFNRETPVHLAVKRGEPRAIKALSNWSRTKLYITDRYGKWPIHRFFAHGPPL
jgi:ankyrin repeat protein